MVSNKRETEASKPVLKVRATLRGRLSLPNDGGNGDVLGRNQSKDMLDEMRAGQLKARVALIPDGATSAEILAVSSRL